MIYTYVYVIGIALDVRLSRTPRTDSIIHPRFKPGVCSPLIYMYFVRISLDK